MLIHLSPRNGEHAEDTAADGGSKVVDKVAVNAARAFAPAEILAQVCVCVCVREREHTCVCGDSEWQISFHHSLSVLFSFLFYSFFCLSCL